MPPERNLLTGNSQIEYLRAVNKAIHEKERLEDAKFKLYDNLQAGIINQSEYTDFQKRYDAQIAAQEAAIQKLQDSLSDLRQAKRQDDEFVSYFEQQGNIQTIDRNVLEQLLDHVTFTDTQHIDIYFKYSPEREKILDFAKSIEENQQTCADVG